ncbi:LysE family transporter [Candidatus Babeliales bacterium]|nr:LysE family transporter [Candidatus Babeliales bacterium]
MNLAFLVQGILVGFSIAAPVGAIGLLCIQNTLQSGIALGLASGFGAATADMMYGILVAVGMRTLSSVLLAYRSVLTLLGGLFLCYLGIKKFFAKPTLCAAQISAKTVFKTYIVTFFLTLTNPATILDFMALFTGLRIDVSNYTQGLMFVAGVFVGSALWWLILCFSVNLFRKHVSQTILQWINWVAGVIIVAFGVWSLLRI